MKELNKLARVGFISGLASICLFFAIMRCDRFLIVVHHPIGARTSAAILFSLLLVTALFFAREESDWHRMYVFMLNAVIFGIHSISANPHRPLFGYVAFVLGSLVFLGACAVFMIAGNLKVRYGPVIIRFVPLWFFLFITVHFFVNCSDG